MIAPFQYLTSFLDCMLLSPNQECPHYSTYPTLLESTYSALHHFSLAPEPFGCTAWAFLALLTICISIVGHYIYNRPIRGKTARRERIEGVWDAVDNLFGYVLGYDTPGEHRTYPYDNEDEWLERMM